MFLKDVFENKMDTKKFRYTNRIWNESKLNSGWSIGYVSDLINRCHFRTKEEWRDFYYNSGKIRETKIAELEISQEEKDKLYKSNVSYKLSTEIKDLNYKYGRTRETLEDKGRILYQEVLKDGNKFNLTEKECIYAVMFRVIGETWNGIIVREKNTVIKLNEIIRDRGYSIEIRKTDGDFDYKYEVDFEIFKGDKLLCGIQIKPKSYINGNSTELKGAKNINEIKNNKYKELFGKSVHYIYSDIDGTILNTNIIDEIMKDLEE